MEQLSTTGGQKGRKGRVVPYRSEDQADPPQPLRGIEPPAGITDREQADPLGQMLATAATDLVDLPAGADLFQFVGRKVHEMIGVGIVGVNSIEGDTLTPRILFGARPFAMNLAQRLLGRSVIDMPFRGVHEVARNSLLSGKLVEVEGGLYELFFRSVPRPVCWTLQKVVGIQACYSIGLRRPNKLFGNVTILTQKGTRLNAQTIESLVNQASMALDRRKAIETLLQTEQRFRVLYESVQAGVVLLRADGTIVHANRMAGEIFNVTPEAVQFKTLADLGCRMILEDGTPVPYEDYPSRITFRTGKPIRGAVRGLYLSDLSQVRWLSISTEPLRRGADAQIQEVLATFHDITPFKRAQSEIESSQRFLQAILNSFPGNVVVINDAGIAVITNDSWAAFGQMNGLDSKYCQGGWSYLEVTRAAKGPGDDRAREAADAIEAVLREQRNYFEMEYPCHSSDLQRWFQLQVQGFVYESRRWAVIAHVDITGRKETEEALRRSEAKYRVLYESMRDGFVSVDMDGRLAAFNGAYQEMLGYSEDELHRLTYRDLTPESWHAMEAAIVSNQILTRGYSDVYEKEYRRKDGAIFPIEIRTSLIRDAAGRPAGMWAIIRDVTERKRLEREIAVREKRLNSFFTGATAGLALLDRDLRYLQINETLAAMNGLPANDHLGKTVREILPHLAPMVEPFLRRVLATGEPVLNVEVAGQMEDRPGVQRHWMESLFPVMGSDGTPEGVGAVVVEITDLKKAERKLLDHQNRFRSLMAELALAEERERRRIGIGLHDQVGQSLAMTKFALQALAQTADRTTAATLGRICDDIDGQIERVRSLSFELSDSILYEVGFKEAVEAYLDREIRRKHGITYRLVADRDFSRLKNDTKIVLFRNLRELLSNVVRHSQAGHVDIRIRMAARKLRISIKDDGVGFKPEDMNHAGAEQAHFGLFSVAEQLRFLGGRLRVRSAPGRGTHIVMIAPL